MSGIALLERPDEQSKRTDTEPEFICPICGGHEYELLGVIAIHRATGPELNKELFICACCTTCFFNPAKFSKAGRFIESVPRVGSIDDPDEDTEEDIFSRRSRR